METVKKIGIWIRVSTDMQVEAESPEHHKQRALQYLQAKGWQHITTYELKGVSGKDVRSHPEANRMLKDVAEGNITGLVFSNLSRLARSTKDLLAFAEYFEEHDADLISLKESLDTSTSSGRLFFTIVAGMTQWEREQIAERVSASVPIRAKLGKSTGGQAPFGYKWENNQLVINEDEANIVRQMFELYLEYKRKRTVATMLNERGYRTRKGKLFGYTSIVRLLTNSAFKGLRKTNYTKSRGKGLQWDVKPRSEWVEVRVPAIVTEDLWDKVNDLLEAQRKSKKKATKRGRHLFSSFIKCGCGGKMYVPGNSPKYICQKCRNKIGEEDMEKIFHEKLKDVLTDPQRIEEWIGKLNSVIQEKDTERLFTEKKAERLKTKMDNLMDLYHEGDLPKEDLKDRYVELHQQHEALSNTIDRLKAEVIALEQHQSSSDYAIQHATKLYTSWPNLSFDEKRRAVEILTTHITISTDNTIEIGIKIPQAKINKSERPQANGLPIPSELMLKALHILRGCCWQ
ncbi:MAG: recombinase family protein [Bacteroidota bacterium]